MSPRLLALTALLGLAACGGKHPGSYEKAAASEGAADEALLEKADALWLERVDEARLEEALAAYEAVLEADPNDREALTRLTRGWYFWGDAFTDDTETKVERWGEAIAYGTRCLSLNEEFASVVQGGGKEKDAVSAATKADAPCLYWTATALGKWGKAQGIARTLRHLPTVKAYISKVEELDPTFFHYGPARYWAAYYAALPSFAGQDLEKSAEYFEAAIEGAPYYLPTRVLRAEYLAVATADAKLFDEDIVAVVTASPDQKPQADVFAENVRDQLKARALFEKRAELFDKDALAAAGEAPKLPALDTASRTAKADPAPAEAPEVKEGAVRQADEAAPASEEEPKESATREPASDGASREGDGEK